MAEESTGVGGQASKVVDGVDEDLKASPTVVDRPARRPLVRALADKVEAGRLPKPALPADRPVNAPTAAPKVGHQVLPVVPSRKTVHLVHAVDYSMGSWRDFLDWFKPSFIAEREKVVHDLLDDNEALRRETARLRKQVRRLEASLESARGREEAASQRAELLHAQARRCKCRS